MAWISREMVAKLEGDGWLSSGRGVAKLEAHLLDAALSLSYQKYGFGKNLFRIRDPDSQN